MRLTAAVLAAGLLGLAGAAPAPELASRSSMRDGRRSRSADTMARAAARRLAASTLCWFAATFRVTNSSGYGALAGSSDARSALPGLRRRPLPLAPAPGPCSRACSSRRRVCRCSSSSACSCSFRSYAEWARLVSSLRSPNASGSTPARIAGPCPPPVPPPREEEGPAPAARDCRTFRSSASRWVLIRASRSGWPISEARAHSAWRAAAWAFCCMK